MKGSERPPGLPWRLEMTNSPHSRPSSPGSPLLGPGGGNETPRRRSFNPSRLLHDEELAQFRREESKTIPLDDVTAKLRSSRIPPWLPAYAPLIIWVLVSLLTSICVAIWHSEVFEALEALSHYLKRAGFQGYALMFACIFITTVPPCPFYGTLIVLAGYTYGVWRAFFLSYLAALVGASAVYLLSRFYFRDTMINQLRRSPGMRKVIHACSRRPRLLFLIRLAPYPYNLVNALAAASDKLTFYTYFWCTALSLPKLLVHTSIGASIRSWISYHSAKSDNSPDMDVEGQRLQVIFGSIGIALCVIVFLWLFVVARRAVDEVDGEELSPVKLRSTPIPSSVATLATVDVDRPR